MLIGLVACSKPAPPDHRYQQVAVDFAAALVARDFPRAHGMLSATAALSPAQLQRRFDDMVAPIGPLSAPQLTTTLDDWPAKQPGDLGWAHVAIPGRTGSEGVTVVVSDEPAGLRVRSVEWGRP